MGTEGQSLSSAGLRRRKPSQSSIKNQPEPKKIENKTQHVKPKLHQSALGGLLIILGCIVFSVALSAGSIMYPKFRIKAASQVAPSAEKPFDMDRAMKHVREISAKPRWVGTASLEEALRYIQDDLLSLQSKAAENGLKLEVELFRSGPSSFSTGVGSIELINTYSNVSSVVARLSPESLQGDSERSSLLVNAHVDSAAGASGANDNVCGVAISMEVLRCLVFSEHYKIKRPIVFLFNGAEEVVLSGAHSFTTQHPWSRSVATHINVEALGSGDTYNLMNLGPYNMWLIESYKNSVSMPSSSVTAADIIHTKIFPGETDFRVFWEFGSIPGFDFVLSDNGYVYHTIYDNIEKVNPLGVYHGGITIFELVLDLAGQRDAIGIYENGQASASKTERFFATLREVAGTLRLVGEPGRLRAVYFDILNIAMIVYDEGVAAVLNATVLFVTILVWIAKLTDTVSFRVQSSFRMLFVILAAFLGSLSSASFAAFIYSEVFGSKLRWYGSLVKAALIYGPPGFFGAVSAVFMLLPRHLTPSRFDEMLSAITKYNFLTAVILMKMGFMSSYIPIWTLVILNFYGLQGASIHPVLRYMGISIAHVLLWSKMSYTSLSALLPLFGRTKSEAVPHDMIAAVLVTFYIFSLLLVPLLPILCHYAQSLRVLLRLTFICTSVIAFSFLIDVPNLTIVGKNTIYSSDAPKRIFAVHFSSPDQSSRNVVALLSFDPVEMDTSRILSSLQAEHGHGSVKRDLPAWGTLGSTSIEATRPLSRFIQDVAVVEVEDSPQLPRPQIYVVEEQELQNAWNVTLTVEALDSHQLTYRLLTGKNSSILDWSIHAPQSDDPSGAWIRHTGTNTYTFWVLLRRNNEQKERPKFKMVVTTARFGISRSEGVLAKLSFSAWEAPVFISSVGVEIEI